MVLAKTLKSFSVSWMRIFSLINTFEGVKSISASKDITRSFVFSFDAVFARYFKRILSTSVQKSTGNHLR